MIQKSGIARNEKAAAAGPRNGSKSVDEDSHLPRKISPSWRAKAIKKALPPAYRAAARMVGYALHLKSDWAIHGAAEVLRLRLTTEDRAILAMAVLHALTDDEFDGVLRHFLWEGA